MQAGHWENGGRKGDTEGGILLREKTGCPAAERDRGRTRVNK